ncbi:hypothetical protein HNY73_004727 [Argiope bruennichi]|uniref:Uncharacterized protein n=1 Tax=Argiope bruennichi TaxID=94029 RepID=A0A8T0FPU3_ARGBR|nr:hypothetical protein HNY73_004727 [Argiope bruennichi]
MIRASLSLLRALTLIAASVALAAQAIAICSNAWLYSIELMPNPRYNGTGDREHLSKHTVSGLWRLCYNDPGKILMRCENIDYFPKEEYSPDPNDSTMAIPYAARHLLRIGGRLHTLRSTDPNWNGDLHLNLQVGGGEQTPTEVLVPGPDVPLPLRLQLHSGRVRTHDVRAGGGLHRLPFHPVAQSGHQEEAAAPQAPPQVLPGPRPGAGLQAAPQKEFQAGQRWGAGRRRQEADTAHLGVDAGPRLLQLPALLPGHHL